MYPRSLRGNQPCGKFRSPGVGLDRVEVTGRVPADGLLAIVEQPWRRKRPQQLVVVVGRRAPVLRDVVGDRRADRHWPVDARRDEPRAVRGVPQGRRLDVLRVPHPAVLIAMQRIERRVVEDAVSGRRDARHHRRVAGIRDGGQHAGHRPCVCALGHQAAQRRNFQTVPIGVGDVLRLQAVYRDQDDGRTGWRWSARGRPEKDRDYEVSSHRRSLSPGRASGSTEV